MTQSNSKSSVDSEHYSKLKEDEDDHQIGFFSNVDGDYPVMFIGNDRKGNAELFKAAIRLAFVIRNSNFETTQEAHLKARKCGFNEFLKAIGEKP